MSNYNDIDDYEIRKQFLEDIKNLNKVEKEELYLILKKTKSFYTENSNGIFFDISKISSDTFELMLKFMKFCKKNQTDFEYRENEQKKYNTI